MRLCLSLRCAAMHAPLLLPRLCMPPSCAAPPDGCVVPCVSHTRSTVSRRDAAMGPELVRPHFRPAAAGVAAAGVAAVWRPAVWTPPSHRGKHLMVSESESEHAACLLATTNHGDVNQGVRCCLTTESGAGAGVVGVVVMPLVLL